MEEAWRNWLDALSQCAYVMYYETARKAPLQRRVEACEVGPTSRDVGKSLRKRNFR